MANPRPTGRPRGQLPLWLASLLVQAGSFVMALGLGVLILSLAYRSQAVAVGLAMVLLGYAAAGFPAWYLTRRPRTRYAVDRAVARVREWLP